MRFLAKRVNVKEGLIGQVFGGECLFYFADLEELENLSRKKTGGTTIVLFQDSGYVELDFQFTNKTR